MVCCLAARAGALTISRMTAAFMNLPLFFLAFCKLGALILFVGRPFQTA
jgi:hypothetical protein